MAFSTMRSAPVAVIPPEANSARSSGDRPSLPSQLGLAFFESADGRNQVGASSGAGQTWKQAGSFRSSPRPASVGAPRGDPGRRRVAAKGLGKARANKACGLGCGEHGDADVAAAGARGLRDATQLLGQLGGTVEGLGHDGHRGRGAQHGQASAVASRRPPRRSRCRHEARRRSARRFRVGSSIIWR